MSLDTPVYQETEENTQSCVDHDLFGMADNAAERIIQSSGQDLYNLAYDLTSDGCISQEDLERYNQLFKSKEKIGQKVIKMRDSIKNISDPERKKIWTRKIDSIINNTEIKNEPKLDELIQLERELNYDLNKGRGYKSREMVAKNKPKPKEVQLSPEMKRVHEVLESQDMNTFLHTIVEGYIGKPVDIGGKISLLTKENMDTYVHNFKRYLLTTIGTECSGDENAANSISTARGCGQWLIGNGGPSVEVADKDKSGYLKWVKLDRLSQKENHERLARIKGHFKPGTKLEQTRYLPSSYENALNRSLNKYNEIKAVLPSRIKKQLTSILPNEKITSKSNRSPIGKSLESQMLLLVLDTVTHTKTKKNKIGKKVGIDDFMTTILHRGEKWEIENTYAVFHHTNPDKKTEKAFDNNFRLTEKTYAKNS